MTPHNKDTGLPGLILNLAAKAEVRARDLPALTGYPDDYVRRTLHEMVEADRLRRTRRGHYAAMVAA